MLRLRVLLSRYYLFVLPYAVCIDLTLPNWNVISYFSRKWIILYIESEEKFVRHWSEDTRVDILAWHFPKLVPFPLSYELLSPENFDVAKNRFESNFSESLPVSWATSVGRVPDNNYCMRKTPRGTYGSWNNFFLSAERDLVPIRLRFSSFSTYFPLFIEQRHFYRYWFPRL